MRWKPPLKEDWDILYKEALKFRKLDPWYYLEDTEIYCIEDPISKTPIFCSILGSNNEVFGLSAHIGLTGMEAVNKIISGNIAKLDEEFYEMHTLLCSFEPWDHLLIEEQIQAEKFDPELKKDQMCPGFICYEPDYVPFSFSQQECQLMTTILKQSQNMIKRAKEDPLFLASGNQNEILVRKYHYTNKNGTMFWKNQWQVFPPYMPIYEAMHLDNSNIKKRLKAYPVKNEVIWEVDALHMPFVIEEGYKPYYPRMLFVVDHHSGFGLEPAMCKDKEAPKDIFLSHFIKLIDGCGFRPKAIMAKNEKTINLFSMVCADLGIALLHEPELPMIEKMKNSLLTDMDQQIDNTKTVH